MPSDELSEAFFGVFNSSKEILKNKQRHLYCSMLDLLRRTCQTTGLAEKKIGIDSLAEFWLLDILPLVFDEDPAIQASAEETFAQGLFLLDIEAVHKTQKWPAIKLQLMSEYPAKINKLRDAKKPQWYQIWCLIIRILDRDILRGASVINSFLSIVELGFRCSDNHTRTEAFHCWRQLIEIFAKYNELSMPKRLKLICIPLKSSQSKTLQSAQVKLHVWWYFLTCLGSKISDHYDCAVGPFLTFLFGSAAKGVTGIAQQYEEVRPLAFQCLITLLLQSRDEYIERAMREYKLEILSLPSTLISPEIILDHWQDIVAACLASMRLLSCDNNGTSDYDNNRRLMQILTNRTLKIVQDLDLAACSEYFFKELINFLPEHKIPLHMIMNVIATEGLLLTRSKTNYENFNKTLKATFSLFVATRTLIPPSILQRCVLQLKNTCLLFDVSSPKSKWLAYQSMMGLLLNDHEADNVEGGVGNQKELAETKMVLWMNAAEDVLEYIRANNLKYRLKEYAEPFDNWIMWPIRNLANNNLTAITDNKFYNVWTELLLQGENSADRLKNLISLKESQKTWFDKCKDKDQFCKIFQSYNEAIIKFIKNNACEAGSLVEETVKLYQHLLESSALTKSCFEVYLKTLLSLWLAIKPSEINIYVQQLKLILKLIGRIALRDNHQQKKFYEEWKRSMLEHVKTPQLKSVSIQLKEALNGDDVFVIIPSVWSLNPDKLTDRQKERFSEKAGDIPALYNDMSQSQDSSTPIKPWTPNKVVIAKKNQTEIVISEKPKANNNLVVEIASSGSDRESPDLLTQLAQRPSSSDVTSSTTSVTTTTTEQRVLRSGKSTGASPVKSDAVVTPIPSETVPIRSRSSLRGRLFDDKVDNEGIHEPNVEKIDKTKDTMENEVSKSPGKNKSSKRSSLLKSLESDEESANKTQTQAQAKPTVAVQKQTIDIIEILSDTPVCFVSNLLPETEDQLVQKTALPQIEINHVTALEGSESVIAETPSQLAEIINPKETSPKRPTIQKLGLLSSPPDRKLTNNSSSPSLRPKPPSAVLFGRGAQLINMIRNKKAKVENTSASPVVSVLQRRDTMSTPVRNEQAESAVSLANSAEQQNLHTSTPLQARDFLTFSKRLPSSSASPSASILKRKLQSDSIDDTLASGETPLSKRKRVSFHDPPVSVTKEYELDCDESKNKSKRCLSLEKNALGHYSGAEVRHSLKRRSRLDSLNEIERFNTEKAEKELIFGLPEPNTPIKLSKERSSLLTNLPAEQLTTLLPDTDVVAEEVSVDKALEIVSKNCSVDMVLAKYLDSESPSTTSKSSAHILSRAVSQIMTTDAKLKATILETLSENHSKEFLDHAVQENLASVVCDRLNLNSVIDYVCAKANLNAGCRVNLLAQIPEILKRSKSNELERFQFIRNIMQSIDLNNDNILDLIKMLLDIRTERDILSTASKGLQHQDSEPTSDVSSTNM